MLSRSALVAFASCAPLVLRCKPSTASQPLQNPLFSVVLHPQPARRTRTTPAGSLTGRAGKQTRRFELLQRPLVRAQNIKADASRVHSVWCPREHSEPSSIQPISDGECKRVVQRFDTRELALLNTVGIVPSEGVFHRNVTQVVSGGKLTLPMDGNCAVAASLDNLDFLPSKDWHLQSRST